MAVEESIIKALESNQVDFICNIPCVFFKRLIEMIDEEFESYKITREEEGVGICAGAYLAGKRPCMVLQNSGIGNSINALASLNKTFNIPLLLLVSHRGVEDEQIVAQVPMGEATPGLLDVLGIPYFEPNNAGEDEIYEIIDIAAKMAYDENKVVAVLFSKYDMKSNETK
jgi:sulfopyruvate decarboxylase subunit alpha